MVIEVLMSSMGRPSKSTSKSSRLFTGTPTLPISGAASGWSEL
jgi:hypothetical protein